MPQNKKKTRIASLSLLCRPKQVTYAMANEYISIHSYGRSLAGCTSFNNTHMRRHSNKNIVFCGLQQNIINIGGYSRTYARSSTHANVYDGVCRKI